MFEIFDEYQKRIESGDLDIEDENALQSLLDEVTSKFSSIQETVETTSSETSNETHPPNAKIFKKKFEVEFNGKKVLPFTPIGTPRITKFELETAAKGGLSFIKKVLLYKSPKWVKREHAKNSFKNLNHFLEDSEFVNVRTEGMENHFEFDEEGFTEKYENDEQKTILSCRFKYQEDKVLIDKIQRMSKEGKLITIERDSNDYLNAKKQLNSYFMNKQELITHLNDCHLFTASVFVFIEQHETLKKEFEPFIFRTREMNQLARQSLIDPEKGEVTKHFNFHDFGEMMDLLGKSLEDLPKRLRQRVSFSMKNSTRTRNCERIMKEAIEPYISRLFSEKEFNKLMVRVCETYNREAFSKIGVENYNFETEELFKLFVFQAMCGHTTTNYDQFTTYSDVESFIPNYIRDEREFVKSNEFSYIERVTVALLLDVISTDLDYRFPREKSKFQEQFLADLAVLQIKDGKLNSTDIIPSVNI